MSRRSQARPPGAAHRLHGGLSALALCAALVAIRSLATAQAEASDVVSGVLGMCLTRWVRIDDLDGGRGPLKALGMGQMHAYRTCPTLPLGEGGGNARSAATLRVASLRTAIDVYYWDFGAGGWVSCQFQESWTEDDSNTWSIAQSAQVDYCPNGAWLAASLDAMVLVDGTWQYLGTLWTPYYWHD
jgi:hypothetical protein